MATLVVIGGLHCVQYNERCKGYVEDPDVTIGKIGGETVPLDKLHVRSDNNAMGQMAADAFVHATYPSGFTPQIGAYNGGGVRSEGVCTSHDSLAANSIVSRGLLHEIFLFDDYVYDIKVSGQQLMDIFQASANGLSAADAGLTDPSGNFLQISGNAQETIDCSRDKGSRVVSLTIGPDAVVPGQTYDLASIDFLFQAGSALDPALVGVLGDSTRAAQASNNPKSSYIAEGYMSSTYGTSSPGLTLDHSEGTTQDQRRIIFNNCELPPDP